MICICAVQCESYTVQQTARRLQEAKAVPTASSIAKVNTPEATGRDMHHQQSISITHVEFILPISYRRSLWNLSKLLVTTPRGKPLRCRKDWISKLSQKDRGWNESTVHFFYDSGAIPPLPQYASMAWYSVKKHRDNFTFYLQPQRAVQSNAVLEYWCRKWLTWIMNFLN
jgi:hypothetical protein